MRKLALLLLILVSVSSAQYYEMWIVRASDHSTMALLYDDNSTSYKDNSLENPDAEMRICALNSGDLQNKWVSLVYADGTNPGDYIEITHAPVQITSVPPTNCVYVPLELSSFKAWYPSIPFLFIGDSPDLSTSERVKFLFPNGWLAGDYTVNSSQAGNLVNITVAEALDDGGNPIVPDVDFLVVGLMMGTALETTDTAIASINDSVVLSLGGYGGTYYIHINGIGPGMFPPEVEILSPEPRSYDTNTIPFIYTITTFMGPVDSCWYILDGQRTDMPDCTISYVLNVRDGSHTLTLYANDTLGQIGQDTVTFRVETEPPIPGGIGMAHIPQPPPPIPPVPPSYDEFDVTPEDIWVIVNYPEEGRANFTLYSRNTLHDVECFVTGDFQEWTRVELGEDAIPGGDFIYGEIIVDMPPTTILDYNDGTQGLMQCVGFKDINSSLMLTTKANVYLVINRPEIMVENITLWMDLGEQRETSLDLTNIGNGTAYTYNLSAVFQGPNGELLTLISLPDILYHGETGSLRASIFIPLDTEPGKYRVPVAIYENGRPMGRGYITIFVEPEIAPEVCRLPFFLEWWDIPRPDYWILWSALILFALANYFIIHKEKLMKRHWGLAYSLAPILLSLPGWWIFNPCFMVNIAFLQLVGTLLYYYRQKQKRDEMLRRAGAHREGRPGQPGHKHSEGYVRREHRPTE